MLNDVVLRYGMVRNHHSKFQLPSVPTYQTTARQGRNVHREMNE
jgi:hypothetical protein